MAAERFSTPSTVHSIPSTVHLIPSTVHSIPSTVHLIPLTVRLTLCSRLAQPTPGTGTWAPVIALEASDTRNAMVSAIASGETHPDLDESG